MNKHLLSYLLIGGSIFLAPACSKDNNTNSGDGSISACINEVQTLTQKVRNLKDVSTQDKNTLRQAADDLMQAANDITEVSTTE